MTVLGNSTETLLSGLSSFWQTMFADKDQLNALYAGSEELLGQAYLDLLTEVLNLSLNDAPLFNKEYWHLFVLREDRLRYDEDHDLPYYTRPDDPLVNADFMLNRIYDPTWSWERGIDFEIEDRALRFYKDPFAEELPGVAERQVTIEPVVYREGADGVYDVNTPRLFSVEGFIREGKDGEIFGTESFRSAEASFSPQDVGRLLEVPGVGTRTIVSVLDTKTVRLDAVAGPVGDSLRWRIRDEQVFSHYDVGDQLWIRNPLAADAQETVEIVSVDPGGLAVTLDRDIPFGAQDIRGISWQHTSPSRVTELSFWMPNAFFDYENLYYSFGHLIGRREPSSESYRALIKGIFQLFMLGPALHRIEAALNVMVGVPVTRESGEIVEQIMPDAVITDMNTYTLPQGSIRSDLDVGTELAAFEPLTEIFTVTDYTEDPVWHYGKHIPPDILGSAQNIDRSVDPELYDTKIGTGKPWKFGDPNVYLGADFDGGAVKTFSGKDAVLGAVDPHLWSYGTKFVAEHVGGSIWVNGHEFTIEDLAGPAAEAVLSGSPEALTALQDFQTPMGGEILFDDDAVFRFTDGEFSSGVDEGLIIDVEFSVLTDNDGKWEVVTVLDADTVRVSPVETAGTPSFAAGTELEAVKSLSWYIPTRPPVRHNPGYNLMRDYVQNHTYFVSYNLREFDIPHLRPDQDVRDVLLEGTPSHIYTMFSPANLLLSTSRVVQHSFQAGLLLNEELTQESPTLAFDGTWPIGGYYQYALEQTVWIDVVRGNQSGEIVELKKSEKTDQVVLSAYITGDGASIAVEIFAWNGTEFAATGETVFIGPGASTDLVTVNTAGRTAVRITPQLSDGVGPVGVQYGLYRPTGGVLVIPPDTDFRDSGESLVSGEFRDTSFDFLPIDLWRVLEVEDGANLVTAYVSEILDANSVLLSDAKTGDAYTLPVGSSYTWRLGTPRKTGTVLTVGGANPRVERGDVVSWPVQVVFADS